MIRRRDAWGMFTVLPGKRPLEISIQSLSDRPEAGLRRLDLRVVERPDPCVGFGLESGS